MTMILSSISMPSICTRISLSVCSRSSWPRRFRCAPAGDGVDFVEEDDAGTVLASLREQVAHARRADADEHFDEVRTGDAEDARRLRRQLTSPGAFCLCRACRSGAAFGNAAAEALELFRILRETHDLFNFLLGFINAADVFKSLLIFSLVISVARDLPNERTRLARRVRQLAKTRK